MKEDKGQNTKQTCFVTFAANIWLPQNFSFQVRSEIDLSHVNASFWNLNVLNYD